MTNLCPPSSTTPAPVSENAVTNPPDPSALVSLQMDYAWKWFCFHADQRTKMFSFMLAALGILLGAVVTMIDKQLFVLSAVLSACGAVLSASFYFLDRRNKRLYGVALNVLIHLEQSHVFGGQHVPDYEGRSDVPQVPLLIAARIMREDQGHGCGSHALHGKHRFWMPFLIVLFGVLFFGAGAFALWQRADQKPTNQLLNSPVLLCKLETTKDLTVTCAPLPSSNAASAGVGAGPGVATKQASGSSPSGASSRP